MATSISSKLSTYEVELFDRVHSYFPNNKPNKFFFFYSNASPFSNFHPCSVNENGTQFHCTEQYMMYHKAKLFNDDEIAEQILNATKPAKCKALGRNVGNFTEEIWKNNRSKIVYDGNYLKFTQNDDLKSFMLKHADELLVEASPSDRIWGVGLSEKDPSIQNPSNWKGLNLLGYILTDIAHRIVNESKNQ